ncbi:MAG TPA: hypothetical protein VGD08_12875 [Stellaceae bacterium]|jgi:hypothetical protein
MTDDVPQNKDTAPAVVPAAAKQSRKGAPPAKRDTLGALGSAAPAAVAAAKPSKPEKASKRAAAAESKPASDKKSGIADKSAASAAAAVQPAAPPKKKDDAAKPAKKAASERTKPLNFRVTSEFRKAFKQAAAAEDCKKVELLERIFGEWRARQA